MNNDAEDGNIISSCFALHNFALAYELRSFEELGILVQDKRDNTMRNEMVQHVDDSAAELGSFQLEEEARKSCWQDNKIATKWLDC